MIKNSMLTVKKTPVLFIPFSTLAAHHLAHLLHYTTPHHSFLFHSLLPSSLILYFSIPPHPKKAYKAPLISRVTQVFLYHREIEVYSSSSHLSTKKGNKRLDARWRHLEECIPMPLPWTLHPRARYYHPSHLTKSYRYRSSILTRPLYSTLQPQPRPANLQRLMPTSNPSSYPKSTKPKPNTNTAKPLPPPPSSPLPTSSPLRKLTSLHISRQELCTRLEALESEISRHRAAESPSPRKARQASSSSPSTISATPAPKQERSPQPSPSPSPSPITSSLSAFEGRTSNSSSWWSGPSAESLSPRTAVSAYSSSPLSLLYPNDDGGGGGGGEGGIKETIRRYQETALELAVVELEIELVGWRGVWGGHDRGRCGVCRGKGGVDDDEG